MATTGILLHAHHSSILHSLLLSLPFFLFLEAFAYSSSASPSTTPQNTTIVALLGFKARFVADPYSSSIFSSWNASSDFCSWVGISCTHSHQVEGLFLQFQGLNGTLSPQIGNLQELSFFDLSYNQLSGPLPSSLGQLKSLDFLDWSHNQLSGPLPSSLGQLKNLYLLDLSHNQLSGPLPSSLGQLKNLESLDLSQNRLFGPLPSSLGQLRSLQRRLSLSQNQLSGPFPSSLGQLKSLDLLDLSQNQLSGPLPSSLGQLRSLYHLDLSQNQLYGPLPSSLGQLNSLEYLDVSQNQFSGPLPPLPYGSVGFLNVSYNRLEGVIPMVYYQQFPSDSFLGNPGLRAPSQDSFLGNPPPSEDSFLGNPWESHAKSNMKLAVVSVVGPVSCLVASFCVWWYCFHRKDPGSNFVIPQYQAWTTEEMKAATNNFDAVNVIGSGSVSTCYLGVMKLPDGIRLVALKRLIVYDKDDDGLQDDEARKSFVNEFKTLSNLRHRNLVKLMGCCLEGGEIALVMEYVEGGDLDKRLHNEAKTRLSWEEKVNVALDVAEGLVYLHHECDQPIIHCDLKPNNILLRSDMVAKISDFGIARLLDVKERGDMSMSKFRGSFGYIAPEYGMGLRISTKVDVYSYGMIILELVTGVRPTSQMLENEAMNLRTWVMDH